MFEYLLRTPSINWKQTSSSRKTGSKIFIKEL